MRVGLRRGKRREIGRAEWSMVVIMTCVLLTHIQPHPRDPVAPVVDYSRKLWASWICKGEVGVGKRPGRGEKEVVTYPF